MNEPATDHHALDAATAEETQIAIAVVEHQGSYLIGQRPKEATLGDLWEFPGGKVEPGETPAMAAVRECREETGLAVAVVGEYPPVVYDYPHGRVRLHFFACRPCDARQSPRPPFCWVKAEELGRYEFPPANAALLAQLRGPAAGREGRLSQLGAFRHAAD